MTCCVRLVLISDCMRVSFKLLPRRRQESNDLIYCDVKTGAVFGVCWSQRLKHQSLIYSGREESFAGFKNLPYTNIQACLYFLRVEPTKATWKEGGRMSSQANKRDQPKKGAMTYRIHVINFTDIDKPTDNRFDLFLYVCRFQRMHVQNYVSINEQTSGHDQSGQCSRSASAGQVQFQFSTRTTYQPKDGRLVRRFPARKADSICTSSPLWQDG